MMIEIRKCVVCGKEYRPKVHNQKTCSEKCRAKYMREYRREYYRGLDKDVVRAKQRDYYWKNHEKVRERQNRWLREHYKRRESNIDDIFNAFNDYLKENYD